MKTQATPDDLVSPGFCVRCGAEVPDAMTVAVVDPGSGPLRIVEACVAHARALAHGRALAPDWLLRDLAAIDAAARPKDTPAPPQLHLVQHTERTD